MTRPDATEERIRTWLHGEASGDLPDWVLGATFDRTRTDPQRSPARRGRLAAILRTPNDQERSPTMINAMRAVAIVAVVAVGAGLAASIRLAPDTGPGVNLVASPSPSPVVVPGAVFVHGTMHLDGSGHGPDYVLTEVEGNRQHEHGDLWHFTSTFDDPRLDGDTTWLFNLDAYPQPGDIGWSVPVEVKWGEIRIENADGAWEGTWSGQIAGATDAGVLLFKMTGEGGYEGLSAMLEGGNWGPYPDMPTAGAIITGDLPPG